MCTRCAPDTTARRARSAITVASSGDDGSDDDGGGGSGAGGDGDTTDTPRLSSAILIRRPGAATAAAVAVILISITDILPRRIITVSLDTLRACGSIKSNRKKVHSREYISRELYVWTCHLRCAHVYGTHSLIASSCLDQTLNQYQMVN